MVLVALLGPGGPDRDVRRATAVAVALGDVLGAGVLLAVALVGLPVHVALTVDVVVAVLAVVGRGERQVRSRALRILAHRWAFLSGAVAAQWSAF